MNYIIKNNVQLLVFRFLLTTLINFANLERLYIVFVRILHIYSILFRNCASSEKLNTIYTMDNTGELSVIVRLSSTYSTLWRYLWGRQRGTMLLAENTTDHEYETVITSVADVIGWKVAVIEDPETLRFGGFSWGSYQVNALASCLTSEHSSPKFSCRCGFHAYKKREDAVERLNRRSNAVLLRVGLYGTMVQHTSGWRAEQQDVLTVHIPAFCRDRGCSSKTSALRKDGESWKAVCMVHAGDYGFTLSNLRQKHSIDAVTDI